MKTYTQSEFDAIARDGNGTKYCPTGDYSRIMEFGDNCHFGEACCFESGNFGQRCHFEDHCRFGNHCHFGTNCKFEDNCKFGDQCLFYLMCRFGMNCFFGEICTFRDLNYFDIRCYFGYACNFGKRCRFGEACRFGERCSFERGHRSIGKQPFVSFSDWGFDDEDKFYFFNFEDGIYVRCGCFLGTIEEFRTRVRDKNADLSYLDIADIAEKRLNEWRGFV